MKPGNAFQSLLVGALAVTGFRSVQSSETTDHFWACANDSQRVDDIIRLIQKLPENSQANVHTGRLSSTELLLQHGVVTLVLKETGGDSCRLHAKLRHAPFAQKIDAECILDFSTSGQTCSPTTYSANEVLSKFVSKAKGTGKHSEALEIATWLREFGLELPEEPSEAQASVASPELALVSA